MIRSLQGFRFVFALMIFFHHLIIPPIDSFGIFPVVFFYVLSGFVLSAGYGPKIENGDLCVRSFIKKRFLKIYPIHIVTLMIAVLIILSSHLYAGTNLYGIVKTMLPQIPNALLIHSWIPIKSVYFSGNAVSWFIANMLFFYLVFPWLFKCVVRLKWYLFLVFSIYIVITSFVPTNLQHALIYINPLSRVFDFSLGIVLYRVYWYSKGCLKDYTFCNTFVMTIIELLIISILACTLMIHSMVPSWISFSLLYWIPASLIILGFTFTERSGGGIFSQILGSYMGIKFGAISFSFFMFHQLLIRIYILADSHLTLNVSFIFVSLILLSLTILISYIYQYKVEPQILNFINRNENK